MTLLKESIHIRYLKKKVLLMCLPLFFINANIKGQSYIYMGENRYEATPTWQFSINSTTAMMTKNPLRVTIGKRGGAGVLLLEKKDFHELPSYRFKGTVLMYLDNGEIIRCIDRGIRDNVNGTAMSLYYLTENEVKKLRKFHIKTIRFNVTHGRFNVTYGGNGQAFTADNTSYLDWQGNYETFITDFYINKLFD